MKSLTAKQQIVLVLCHLMGRRRSFEVGNWVIEMKFRPFQSIYNGSNYSRRWRELKGEDYWSWFYEDSKRGRLGHLNQHNPTFTKSTNTWHLPKEFCKFLRSERDRILRGDSG